LDYVTDKSLSPSSNILNQGWARLEHHSGRLLLAEIVTVTNQLTYNTAILLMAVEKIL